MIAELQTKDTSTKRVYVSARRSIGGSAGPEVDRPCGTAVGARCTVHTSGTWMCAIASRTRSVNVLRTLECTFLGRDVSL